MKTLILSLLAVLCIVTFTHHIAAQVVNPKIALVYSPDSNLIPVSIDSSKASRNAGYVNSGDSVKVISYVGGKYCLIALPPGLLANEGFVIISVFKYDSAMVEFINTHNRNAADPLRLSFTPPTTALSELVNINAIRYKRDQTADVIDTSDYSSGSNSDSRVIHTGPKGGRYYINKNGNKTYIKD